MFSLNVILVNENWHLTFNVFWKPILFVIKKMFLELIFDQIFTLPFEPCSHNSFTVVKLFHTVSFDWFLSSLEWIINLEFHLIFYQKSLWNIRSRFNFSTLWVFESVFRFHFWCNKLQFWSNISKYRLKNSKCGSVKPRSDIP